MLCVLNVLGCSLSIDRSGSLRRAYVFRAVMPDDAWLLGSVLADGRFPCPWALLTVD